MLFGRLSMLVLVYALLSRLAMVFAVFPQSYTAVWAPSGLALATLVLSERRVWPLIGLAVCLTSLGLQLYAGNSWIISLGFAMVHGAAPILAAWLLVRCLGTPITLQSRKEVMDFLWLAVGVSGALTAVPGAALASLGLGAPFWQTWRMWWFADGVGVLVLAPIILTWTAAGTSVLQGLTRYQVLEGLCLGLALTIVDPFVFGARDGSLFMPLPYMTFPVLFWAALRFGAHGAATASLVLAVVAIWKTAYGLGPFVSAGQAIAQQVLEVQIFLAVAVFSSLMAAAFMAEHTQTEEALRHNQSLLDHITNNTPALIYVKALDGSYVLVNNQFEKLFGLSKADLRDKTDYDIFPPEVAAQHRANDVQVLHNRTPLQCEEYVPHPDGLHPYIAVKFPLCDAAGVPYATCSIATDITERTQVEEHLKGALHAKETLLKEIHHRVKNNLQIIASLLNLQAKQVTAPQTLALLHDSQNRIRAMALIHEYLYRAADLARVDTGSYLRNLTAQLRRGYHTEAQGVTLHCTSDDIFLNIETAIPCGLIVNELVSNALKHAFPTGGPGTIDVTLQAQADATLCLMVRDTGSGIPSNLDVEQAPSLGLRLVKMLTQQLQGTLAIERLGGTTFTLRFAELHYQERS